MSQLPARILHDLDLEVATLAQDSARVDHSWVARSRSLGAGVEAQWARLPDAVRAQVEAQVAQALRVGLGIAKAAPQTSPRQQRWMVIASGAAGGAVGLAGALAQLNADWSVAKARLGFNNPDNYRTTFSLRAENYRILSGTAGDPGWRAILQAARRDNLLDDPDAARYCLNLGLSANLAVPGLILEFSTTISPGYNFFGQPLAGGDSVFSETSFATKIRASGVAFTGYSGMVGPNATTNVVTSIGGTSPQDPYTAYTSAAALSALAAPPMSITGKSNSRLSAVRRDVSLRNPRSTSNTTRSAVPIDTSPPSSQRTSCRPCGVGGGGHVDDLLGGSCMGKATRNFSQAT